MEYTKFVHYIAHRGGREGSPDFVWITIDGQLSVYTFTDL